MFDYHVGDPLALIGGTFAYDQEQREFAAWFWTEQPDKVDGITAEEAKAAVNAFVARMK